MRRRLLLVVLWLAGTAGATGVVSYAVSQLSTDLASVNANNSRDTFTPTTVVFRPGTTEGTPPSATAPTVVASTADTVAPEVTATTAEPILDVEVSIAAATPSTTRAPAISTPTTRPGTVVTVAPAPVTTQPAPVTAPPAPVTTAPTPPPPTTPPPTTPPPTTAAPPPEVSCANDVQAVQRIGTIFYRACTDGIHFVTAKVASGAWSATATAVGPPSVTVRFSSTTGQSLTCTLSGNIGGVTQNGDC